MRAVVKGISAMGAVVLIGTATTVCAETPTQSTVAPKANAFATSTDISGPNGIPYPHRTYAFDAKGRWGVKLDLSQPTNRDMDWKDVEAGAYFRLSPNLRLGGSVGLGDKFAQPQHITPQDTGPRVHLEGAFKF